MPPRGETRRAVYDAGIMPKRNNPPKGAQRAHGALAAAAHMMAQAMRRETELGEYQRKFVREVLPSTLLSVREGRAAVSRCCTRLLHRRLAAARCQRRGEAGAIRR
jgi:hypothetical protein